MSFLEMTVIVEGALESTMTFDLTDEGEAAFDVEIERVRLATEADRKRTEIYVLHHFHSEEEWGRGECSCMSYLTDHSPVYVWPPDGEEV